MSDVHGNVQALVAVGRSRGGTGTTGGPSPPPPLRPNARRRSSIGGFVGLCVVRGDVVKCVLRSDVIGVSLMYDVIGVSARVKGTCYRCALDV